MAWMGWTLCALGMLVLLVAALGVVRLPDALARQHAATKAGTMAVALFATGAALVSGDPVWAVRLGVVVVLLLLTLPLASHALSRAAAREMARRRREAPPR